MMSWHNGYGRNANRQRTIASALLAQTGMRRVSAPLLRRYKHRNTLQNLVVAVPNRGVAAMLEIKKFEECVSFRNGQKLY